MSARRGLLSRLNTIRTKIILLPLVLLAVAITALAGATVYFIRMNMLREMEQANFQLAEQVVERVADNNQALAVIHEALEDKILTVGRMVITNKWSITSAYLTQLPSTRRLMPFTGITGIGDHRLSFPGVSGLAGTPSGGPVRYLSMFYMIEISVS